MSPSASSRPRRVEASPSAPGAIPASSYSDAFEVEVQAASSLTALDWARTIFEQAPRAVQRFVVLGWKYGLALRLGPPSSADHVLGWKIGDCTAGSVVLEQHSALLHCHLVVATSESHVRFYTFVSYHNRFAGLLWVPTAVLHRRIVPYLLAHATKSRTGERA